MRNYFKKLPFHFWGELGAQCILANLNTVISMLVIYIIQVLVDCVGNKDDSLFLTMLPCIGGLIIVEILTCFGNRFLLARVQSKFAYQLRMTMTERLLYVKSKEMGSISSGKLLHSYQEQLDLVIDYLKNAQNLIVNPVMFVLAGIYFIKISPILYIISLVAVPLSSFLYGKISGSLQKKKKTLNEEKAQLSEQVKDSMQGLTIMKAYQLEAFFIQRYNIQNNQIFKLEKKMAFMESQLGRLFSIIRFVPQLIIPLIGGYLAFCGKLSVGELMAATLISPYVFRPIEQFLTMRKEGKLVEPAVDQIMEIMNLSMECVSETEQVKNSKSNKIELENISVSYESEKPVLNELNLKVDAGEHVVIIGESGSGKSTLVHTIMGMLLPNSGKIRIGTENVMEQNGRDIRNQIAFIPQKTYLFAGTVYENIALSKDRSLDDVMKAAKMANIHDFIENLPEGYDTLIGNGGIELSGGQAQRISIARQILRDCEFILMDEPTSALDEQNEHAVMKNLREVFAGKSSIMITHRMEVVEEKDTIYHLKGGVLYEA